MEINGMLPIGSVVLLENSKKKVMVVGLAQRSAQNPGRIYDYVGVVFPEGFLDASKIILFNNNNIDQVFMIGYQDAEELSFKMRMDEALRKLRTEGELTRKIPRTNTRSNCQIVLLLVENRCAT